MPLPAKTKRCCRLNLLDQRQNQKLVHNYVSIAIDAHFAGALIYLSKNMLEDGYLFTKRMKRDMVKEC